MPRFLEIAICLFAQCVAAVGILVGLGFVAPLLQSASAAMQGQAWQAGELARLFAAVCGPVMLGSLSIMGLTWYLWSSHVLRKRMQQYPDQPWMWQSDWAKKSIQLSNHAAFWITVISSMMYGLIVVPMGIYLASLKNPGLVSVFVGAIGCFLLLFFRILWQNRRWNCSHMQFETLPGMMGGRFEGVVTIPESIPVGTVLRIALRCDMTRSASTTPNTNEDLVDMALGTERSRNGQSSLQTKTIYEDRQVLTVPPAALESAATVLPISFPIPRDLPSSGKQRPSPSAGQSHRTRVTDYCHWRVQIKPEQTTDLREIIFEIPVFDMENSATSRM